MYITYTLKSKYDLRWHYKRSLPAPFIVSINPLKDIEYPRSLASERSRERLAGGLSLKGSTYTCVCARLSTDNNIITTTSLFLFTNSCVSWRVYYIMCILYLVIYCFFFLFFVTDACSSRSTPKPRPLQPTARPNVTFHTYPCPQVYAKWYCLNDATCFAIKIGESLLYNCEWVYKILRNNFCPPLK